MENKSFEREVLDRLITLETLLKEQDYKSVKEKVDISYTTSIQNKQDIKDIQDNNKWLWRTTIGAIIVALVGILFSYLK